MADRARQTAAIAGLVSVALNAYSGWESPQTVLRILFVFWIAGPFVALVIGNRMALRWSARTRGILGVVTYLVAVASLALYVHAAVAPGAWKPAAFPWTAGPALGWGFIALGALFARIVRPRTSGTGVSEST